MTTRVRQIIDDARQLSPVEQLEIIQTLSQSLQRQWTIDANTRSTENAIPSHIPRTPPVTNLAALAAPFWPEDESADDINTFVEEQRLQTASTVSRSRH